MDIVHVKINQNKQSNISILGPPKLNNIHFSTLQFKLLLSLQIACWIPNNNPYS
jgi:hypothetical protein